MNKLSCFKESYGWIFAGLVSLDFFFVNVPDQLKWWVRCIEHKIGLKYTFVDDSNLPRLNLSPCTSNNVLTFWRNYVALAHISEHSKCTRTAESEWVSERKKDIDGWMESKCSHVLCVKEKKRRNTFRWLYIAFMNYMAIPVWSSDETIKMCTAFKMLLE